MAFTWSNPSGDLTTGGEIFANTFTEIQNNVDHVDDNLECDTHNATYFSDAETGHNNTYNSGDDGSQYTGYDSSNDYGVDGTQHGTYDNDQNTGIYGPNYGTNNNPHYTTERGAYNGTADAHTVS